MGAEYGGYRIFNRGDTGVAGLMALPDDSIPAHWQPYVAVEDPDATAATAGELGGATLAEPMDVDQLGRIAVPRDPQGATFGIIRPEPAYGAHEPRGRGARREALDVVARRALVQAPVELQPDDDRLDDAGHDVAHHRDHQEADQLRQEAREIGERRLQAVSDLYGGERAHT